MLTTVAAFSVSMISHSTEQEVARMIARVVILAFVQLGELGCIPRCTSG